MGLVTDVAVMVGDVVGRGAGVDETATGVVAVAVGAGVVVVVGGAAGIVTVVGGGA